MGNVSISIYIDAPQATVWETLSDLSCIQDYHPNILKSYYTSDTRETVGTSRHCDLPGGTAVEERIIEWNDGLSYRFELVDSKGMPIKFKQFIASFSVNETANGTEVIGGLDYKFRDGIFGAMFDFLLKSQMRKAVRINLSGLKHYLETGEVVTQSTKLIPRTGMFRAKKK